MVRNGQNQTLLPHLLKQIMLFVPASLLPLGLLYMGQNITTKQLAPKGLKLTQREELEANSTKGLSPRVTIRLSLPYLVNGCSTPREPFPGWKPKWARRGNWEMTPPNNPPSRIHPNHHTHTQPPIYHHITNTCTKWHMHIIHSIHNILTQPKQNTHFTPFSNINPIPPQSPIYHTC